VNGTMVTEGDISFEISVLIVGRHENGRPCRVGCSMLPYVTAHYAAGRRLLFRVIGVGA
jgi:hypothetical protein